MFYILGGANNTLSNNYFSECQTTCISVTGGQDTIIGRQAPDFSQVSDHEAYFRCVYDIDCYCSVFC